MNVYGIDFTSRPSRSKPIACAKCQLDGDRLTVDCFQPLESLDAFDTFLESPGPWIAGIDLPFGQPRLLVENLNWPRSWADYVAHVGRLSRGEFRVVLEDYKRDRAKGDREHSRLVDHLTGAQSPSKLYGVPVALMFYEGAPRLLQSAASVIPVRPNAGDRIVVEAYPAMVAQALVGRAPYKRAERGDVHTPAQNLRDRIVQKLSDRSLFATYGLRVDLRASLRRVCITDAGGDFLDAVLAAVQAAWSWTRRDEDYGVPQDCDRLEGWMVDPVTQPSVNSSITRVRPVFRRLLERDPTGSSWLSRVLQLSKSSTLAGTTRSEPGIILPALSKRRRYHDPVQGNIELECCFEFSVAPGRRFLRWLLENPDRMTWPASAGRHKSYSAATQAHREALVGRRGGFAQKQVQTSALRSLYRNGPEKSARRWWAFEGFTEVDCCLQTNKLVLLIEGKRTEGLSQSTAWYPGRNQLYRNLEAARDLAAGREFGVFIVGEKEIPETALGSPETGLPHLNSAERAELMSHYFGTLNWPQVCEVTGMDYRSLPRNVARRVKRPRGLHV